MAFSPTDSFVNSQEWTLSRSVPELKVVSEAQASLGLGGLGLGAVGLGIAPPLLRTRPLPAAPPPGPLPRPQPWPFSVLVAFALPSPCCPLTMLSPIPLPQGIVGNLSSGKSALVHRYLTGTYVQEESPEGERPRLAWAVRPATLPSPSFLLSVGGLEPLALLSPPVSPSGSCGFLSARPRERFCQLRA